MIHKAKKLKPLDLAVPWSELLATNRSNPIMGESDVKSSASIRDADKSRFISALNNKRAIDQRAQVRRSSNSSSVSMLRPDGELRMGWELLDVMRAAEILTAQTEDEIFAAQTTDRFHNSPRRSERIVTAFLARLNKEAQR